MTKAILSLLFFAWCMLGSHPATTDRAKNLLAKADSYMELHPDSALLLLQDIGNAASLQGKAQADYALLYSQACDKNLISITHDSLIQIAVKYYKDKKENLNAAKSYFYLGCVYRNANQDAMAIEAYLKALGKMPEGITHKLWMQIYFNLGERYFNQSFYNNSMEMYQKCLEASKELKDSSLLFFPYRGIAKNHLLTEKIDSALAYYQKALDISRFIHNEYWEAGILNDIAKTYLHKRDTLKAYQFITASIQKDESAGSLYLRSKLLYYRNELDSAKLFLLEGCQSPDLYAKTNCYNLLYKIEKKMQNHANAYTYNDSFNIYRDSIEVLKQHEKVEALHIKYAMELQKREVEKREEKIYWIGSFIIIIILLGGLCFYLYLMKKQKELLLKQKLLSFKDQSQTISSYLEEKLGEEISLQETASVFKREQLQKGLASFNASAWGGRLKEMEKQIKSGDYIKPDEQPQLYHELEVHFKEFIADFTKIYPKMSKDDIYYCILSSLSYKSRIIMYCMSSSGGALRTRKNRLKKNIAGDTFQMIFDN